MAPIGITSSNSKKSSLRLVRLLNTELFCLAGKSVIVTGSTRGIGHAIADEFCRAGASCVISSEDAHDVKAATEELRKRGHAVAGQTCDVRDTDALQDLVDEAATTFGGLDILVCNAGISGLDG